MTQSVTLADTRLVLLQFTTSNDNQIPRSLFCLSGQKKEERETAIQKKEARGNQSRVLIQPGHSGPQDDPQKVDAQLLPVQLLESGFEFVDATIQKRPKTETSLEHYAMRFFFARNEYAEIDRDFQTRFCTIAFFGLESLLSFGLWKLRCYKNERNDKTGRWQMASINFDHREPLVTPYFELIDQSPSHALTFDGRSNRLVLDEIASSNIIQQPTVRSKQAQRTQDSYRI